MINRVIDYVVIILFCYFVQACNFMSSSGNKALLETQNLQTGFKYTIEVHVNEELASDVVAELKVINSIDKQPDYYSVEYDVNRVGYDYFIEFQLIRLNPNIQRESPQQLHLVIPILDIDEVFEISVWDTPSVNELNLPQLKAFTIESTIKAIGEKGGVYFYWLNLPSWLPPVIPNWREDPYDNSSWRLFYHSLGWLNSYVELYQRTGRQHYLDTVKSYLDAYNNITTSPEESPIAEAYREDAVSLRVNHLLSLYLNVFIELPAEEREIIENLLDKDIAMLLIYLEQRKWDDKNHGLIQARAALNIVATLPFHQANEALFESAERRLTALSEQLFSEHGYIVEQATEYHFVSLSMMLEAKVQLQTFNMPENLYLNEKIEKALIVAPYLLYPDGSMPAIGDSSYGKNWSGYLNRYYQEYQQKIPELESYFDYGEQSLSNTLWLPDEGLVIAKYQPVGEKLSKVFFDAGKSPIVHGHYDNLNIVAMLNGQKILVDSGGPYTYEKENREQFWQRSAHNLVVVNDEQKPESDAEVIAVVDKSTQIDMSGKMLIGKSNEHTRSIILTKAQDPVLIVIDSVSDIDESDDVKHYWHYAADFESVNVLNDHIELKTGAGSSFFHYQLSRNSLGCSLLKGVYADDGVPSIGWVTPTYNKLTPASVLSCDFTGEDYFQVNVFSSTPLDSPYYQLSESGIDVYLSANQTVHTNL